jgi:microcystin-dependent protein
VRFLPLAVGLLLTGFLAHAPGAHAARPLGLPQGKAVLFAVEADRGTLTRVEGSKDRFVLTLGSLPTQAVWFTDRPARQSGSVALGPFFSAWKGLGFRSDPPNAVISITGGKKRSDAVTVELGKPRYDKRTRTVRFGVRMLRTLSAGLAHIGPRLDKALPATFGATALFIDDSTTAPPTYCDTTAQLDLLPALGYQLSGYERADGHLVSALEYPTLDALIGDTFGSYGTIGFGLPNLTAPSGLQYDVCTDGAFPLRSEGDYDGRSECAMGQISMFAQPYTPSGWVPADGRTLQSDQSSLDDVIGSAFGGDGTTTFDVPKIPGVGGLKAYICANGTLWDDGGPFVTCRLSQIALFASFNLPENYASTSGQIVSIDQQSALFSLIGTMFGGDGNEYFMLPNLPPPYPGTRYGLCTAGTYPVRA